MSSKKVRAWGTVAVLAFLLWTMGSAAARPSAEQPASREEIGVAAVVTPLLQYQGRLTDPGTGDPVPDGVYEVSFRLYNVESGGAPLWTETGDVAVQAGLFSTVLGDTTALNLALFNGQALWLGIKVGADAEATPRQPVLPVAYALSLVPGAMVQANSGPVLQVNHTGGGEALRVGGNLNVSGSLVGGSHSHSGEAITAGTVADARIASSIARDAEVAGAVSSHSADPDAHHTRYTDPEAWNAVLSRDGPGSGLNADLLDGLNSSEFTQGREVLSIVLDGDGSGSGLDADLLDGLNSSDFATSSHTHDTRYHTKGESNDLFVNVAGDAMSGPLTVPQVVYSLPRTRYFVVGSEGFVPGSSVNYENTYGNGGAYIDAAGCHALVAPVHLPHGATVTAFKVFFQDDSAGDMTVWLQKQHMTGGGYLFMAQLSTSGTPGYSSLTTTAIDDPVINNTINSLHVYAYSCAWDSNLRIKGALITFTITEAS